MNAYLDISSSFLNGGFSSSKIRSAFMRWVLKQPEKSKSISLYKKIIEIGVLPYRVSLESASNLFKVAVHPVSFRQAVTAFQGTFSIKNSQEKLLRQQVIQDMYESKAKWYGYKSINALVQIEHDIADLKKSKKKSPRDLLDQISNQEMKYSDLLKEYAR